MSYFDLNMETINACKNYLSKKLGQYRENIEEGKVNEELILKNVRLLETLDGGSTIIFSKEGNDFRLNSLYCPEHEAKRWVNQYEMKNIGIVISMFGIGNGVFVREVLGKLGTNGILLIYEPSIQLFDFVLENYDISDILSAENVSITIENVNDNEIKNLLSSYVDWYNLQSQITCIHPQYSDVFQNSLETFYKIVNDNNDRAIVNKNTDLVNSRIIIDNMLKNFGMLKKCNVVTDFIGKFPKDVPAIIVAAGPSLDKNIEDLKLAKGRAVIFAVDTAVKYLFAHEIIPDFIVTLDPKKSTHHLADPRAAQIPLFCRLDSRPESIRMNQKRVILYNIEDYAKSLYQRLDVDTGSIHAGGSVATGTFSLCEMIGFQHIILVGQDLAYSGEATHAGGLITDVSKAGIYTEVVEDIYGNPIKTRYDWYVYIRWFEDAVELFDGQEVIDATEGGAKIHGTKIMTLKEAINKYCISEVDCNTIVNTLQPTLGKEKIDEAIRYLGQDLDEMVGMKPKLEEAIELCDKLIDKYEKTIAETKSTQIKNKRIGEINQEIEEKMIYKLLDLDISNDTAEQIYDIYLYTDDEQKDILTTYRHAKTIYNALLRSIGRLQPILEEAYKDFASEEAR